jgi:hypothetical protein
MPDLPHSRPDHDSLLVVALAGDDLSGADAAAARAQVAECPGCAQLLEDVRAIAAAAAALPPPRRPRDFRLTEADAARLRPTGWRGLLRRFGDPGFAFTRPLATGLATLGIAGLLLATLAPAFPAGFGSAGAALAPQNESVAAASDATDKSAGSAATSAPGALFEPSASPAAGGPVPAGPTSGPGRSSGVPTASAAPSSAFGTAPSPAADSGGPPAATTGYRDAGGGPSALAILSIGLLATGLGLGALRLIGGRLA